MSDRHSNHETGNPFLTAPIGRLFLSNAMPMAVVMSMGGILNVVDGIFVGRFLGAGALAAVSLAFPFAMLLSALSTLVGGGMSSLMARQLGAGERKEAGRTFAAAHGLALLISVGLVLPGLGLGASLVDIMAAGDSVVAGLARDYMLVMLLGTPVQLALGLHADALRNEGSAGLIAILSVLVNLFNIGLNWLAIVVLNLGIAGSALGTLAAQAIGLALLIAMRRRRPELLSLSVLRLQGWYGGWRAIVVLGLPLCLSFTGVALVAGTVLLALQMHAGAAFETVIAAHGVVTRLMGLAFLPQLAIALATQSITGNNVGAGRQDRARAALRLAMATAFFWSLSVVVISMVGGVFICGLFTDDPAVARTGGEILRPMMALYAASGPILVLAMHFQAMGQPGRTAMLTLVKPWILTPALVLILSGALGLQGIWLAFPVADALMLLIVALNLRMARGTLAGQNLTNLGAQP